MRLARIDDITREAEKLLCAAYVLGVLYERERVARLIGGFEPRPVVFAKRVASRGVLSRAVLQSVIDAGLGGIRSRDVARKCCADGGTPASVRGILSRMVRYGALTYDGLYRVKQQAR